MLQASPEAEGHSSHTISSTTLDAHKPHQGSISTGRTALAGTLATICTKVVLHPIDTVKCRMQLYSMNTSTTTTSNTSLTGYVVRRREQLANTRRQFEGKWGPRHLFGGLPIKLVFYIPYQMAYMSSYTATQRALMEMDPSTSSSSKSVPPPLFHTITAACAAEMSSCIIRVPMEALKMRIQSATVINTKAAVEQLWRNGLRACARLVVPQTLLHDVPYSVIQWLSYEAMRPWAMTWSHDVTGAGALEQRSFRQRYGSELLRTLCTGGLSGLIAATITVPLDNIRTRVTVETANAPTRSVGSIVAEAYRRGGLSSFYRGGGMRVVWITSNMALYFPLFELFKHTVAS